MHFLFLLSEDRYQEISYCPLVSGQRYVISSATVPGLIVLELVSYLVQQRAFYESRILHKVLSCRAADHYHVQAVTQGPEGRSGPGCDESTMGANASSVTPGHIYGMLWYIIFGWSPVETY